MATTLLSVHGFEVPLITALDFEYLFSSFSSQRNSIDRSIRANVNVIGHDFETGSVPKIL